MNDNPEFEKKKNQQGASDTTPIYRAVPSGKEWMTQAEEWVETVESDKEKVEPPPPPTEPEGHWYDTVQEEIKKVESGQVVLQDPETPPYPMGVIGGNPEPSYKGPVPGKNVIMTEQQRQQGNQVKQGSQQGQPMQQGQVQGQPLQQGQVQGQPMQQGQVQGQPLQQGQVQGQPMQQGQVQGQPLQQGQGQGQPRQQGQVQGQPRQQGQGQGQPRQQGQVQGQPRQQGQVQGQPRQQGQVQGQPRQQGQVQGQPRQQGQVQGQPRQQGQVQGQPRQQGQVQGQPRQQGQVQGQPRQQGQVQGQPRQQGQVQGQPRQQGQVQGQPRQQGQGQGQPVQQGQVQGQPRQQGQVQGQPRQQGQVQGQPLQQGQVQGQPRQQGQVQGQPRQQGQGQGQPIQQGSPQGQGLQQTQAIPVEQVRAQLAMQQGQQQGSPQGQGLQQTQAIPVEQVRAQLAMQQGQQQGSPQGQGLQQTQAIPVEQVQAQLQAMQQGQQQGSPQGQPPLQQGLQQTQAIPVEQVRAQLAMQQGQQQGSPQGQGLQQTQAIPVEQVQAQLQAMQQGQAVQQGSPQGQPPLQQGLQQTQAIPVEQVQAQLQAMQQGQAVQQGSPQGQNPLQGSPQGLQQTQAIPVEQVQAQLQAMQQGLQQGSPQGQPPLQQGLQQTQAIPVEQVQAQLQAMQQGQAVQQGSPQGQPPLQQGLQQTQAIPVEQVQSQLRAMQQGQALQQGSPQGQNPLQQNPLQQGLQQTQAIPVEQVRAQLQVLQQGSPQGQNPLQGSQQGLQQTQAIPVEQVRAQLQAMQQGQQQGSPQGQNPLQQGLQQTQAIPVEQVQAQLQAMQQGSPQGQGLQQTQAIPIKEVQPSQGVKHVPVPQERPAPEPVKQSLLDVLERAPELVEHSAEVEEVPTQEAEEQVEERGTPFVESNEKIEARSRVVVEQSTPVLKPEEVSEKPEVQGVQGGLAQQEIVKEEFSQRKEVTQESYVGKREARQEEPVQRTEGTRESRENQDNRDNQENQDNYVGKRESRQEEFVERKEVTHESQESYVGKRESRQEELVQSTEATHERDRGKREVVQDEFLVQSKGTQKDSTKVQLTQEMEGQGKEELDLMNEITKAVPVKDVLEQLASKKVADTQQEFDSLADVEEEEMIEWETPASSLIQLKEPNILVDKPKYQPTESRDSKSETPPLSSKKKTPLIQLAETKMGVAQTSTAEEKISYDQVFDLENLPKQPPVEEEIDEKDDLPEDHPLHDILEQLHQPLPTDRFSQKFLDNVKEEEGTTAPSEFESVFERRMREISEQGKFAKQLHEEPKEEKKSLTRTPYEDDDPMTVMKNLWKKTFSKKDGKKESLNPQEKQYKLLAMMTLISLCIALVACGVFYFGVEDHSVVSVVQLDVNPSIQISVTKNQEVMGLTALNAQAQEVIAGVDYEGKTLEQIVQLLASLLVVHHYIQDGSTVFATVLDENQVRGEALSVNAKEYLDKALQSVNSPSASVGLWVDPEFDVVTLASTQEIALGKMVVIQELMEMNAFFTMDKLKEYSHGELFQLYVSGGTALPIGLASASELARQATYLSENDSYNTMIESRLDHPLPHYYVAFQTSTKEFQVEIDGFSGGIISLAETAILAMATSSVMLPQQAKFTALNYVGVLEVQVENLTVSQDWSKGRLSYQVNFLVKDTYHTVTIFAATGVVEDHSKTEVDASYTKDLGQSNIQEIAFTDAGVSKSQLDSVLMEQRLEGEELIYSVKFWLGNRQYAYDITGEGTIIYSQFEDFGDQAHPQNLLLISETNAKDIALDHAGLNFSFVQNLTVNLDMELNYVVAFYLNQTPYHYVISGETGEVLFFEKEDVVVEEESSQEGENESEWVEETGEEESLEFNEAPDIGEEAAREIALSAANLKAVMISSFEISTSGTGYEKVYVVGFWFMGSEYQYRISATSGEILDVYFAQREVSVSETPVVSQDEFQETYDSFVEGITTGEGLFNALDNTFMSPMDFGQVG